MSRTFVITAAILGLIGVALGAFGAHGLRDILAETGRADSFETASRYQMIHALALLAVAVLYQRQPSRMLRRAGSFFIAGIIVFCGALYILAIFNLEAMGALAPIGGLALIAGWACLAWAAWQQL
jgi:uncharacterized membrane protein YgdD (TMEM256/DUF423 family)